jgi:C4-dicarboxylate-specific signal transduction histidine kinase
VTEGSLLDLADHLAPGATRAEPLRWLLRLRWYALLAVLAAALLAPLFSVGVNAPLLLGGVALGTVYNLYFAFELRRRPERVRNPLFQVLPDFGALTLVLWASGGVANPFLSLFFVHVVLVSVLSGRRATLIASAMALLCTAFLVVAGTLPALAISRYAPAPGYEAVFHGLAFVVTILASAYVANRSAAEVALRRREAEAARRASKRDTEILLSALDRLEVGVEVVGPDGAPRFQNRHLREKPHDPLACWRDSSTCEPIGGRCPVEEARDGRPGACRFSQRDRGGRERVIELQSYPLSDERPAAVLRLHLDRTEDFLAERKLLFAERLASLGRTVQAVAHELNTPLATIQTLAADMRAALAGAPPNELRQDLDQSAAIILDEMRRCRAITQDLLGRRELLAGGTAGGPTAIGAAVRRAATLVFGTNLSRARLAVEPALETLSVAMGSDSLVQVFVNLLQNAADVIDGRPGAGIRVRAGALGLQDGRIEVWVDDDGPGLAPGVRDRLFEAFFTTKPPGQGTGLGLYTALSLVREAGGTLALDDRPDGGARARLVLPNGGAA